MLGLDQDQQRLQNIQERQETHRSAHHERRELYDVRTEEVHNIDYHEPIPKVTFQEEREVRKDVSFTLGLEDYEQAEPFEPLPVEKITFEETREVINDHDVAVVFALDTEEAPEPERVASPRPLRPVSALSDATVQTREIPQPIPTTTVREEIKTVETFEQITLDARVVVSPPPPESPPSGAIIASAEIIPPLPRKVSISAAIESEYYFLAFDVFSSQGLTRFVFGAVWFHDAPWFFVVFFTNIFQSAQFLTHFFASPPPIILGASVHHNEVDLDKPVDRTRIFETSVERDAKERRQRVEQKLQVRVKVFSVFQSIDWLIDWLLDWLINLMAD